MANRTATGQYECQHSPGIGLDYFTARVDRLILRADGHFTLIVQKQSRAVGAAQSWIKGEQATNNAQESRLEGDYTQQDRLVTLRFEHGGFEEAHLAWNGEGIQVGPNFFKKVSDSTLLPPTHRLKQDMEDIAKGVKIASTLGGFAMKAARSLQGAIQPEAGNAEPSQTPAPGAPRPVSPPSPSPSTSQTGQSTNTSPHAPTRLFCEQCGTPYQPGKRFCNHCGARLP
jgi:hypothetical protein